MSENVKNVSPTLTNFVPEKVYHNVQDTTNKIEQLSKRVGELQGENNHLLDSLERQEREHNSNKSKVRVTVENQHSMVNVHDFFIYGNRPIEVQSIDIENLDEAKEVIKTAYESKIGEENKKLQEEIVELKRSNTNTENSFREDIDAAEQEITSLERNINNLKQAHKNDLLEAQDEAKKHFEKRITNLKQDLANVHHSAAIKETELSNALMLSDQVIEQLKKDIETILKDNKFSNIFSKVKRWSLLNRYENAFDKVSAYFKIRYW